MTERFFVSTSEASVTITNRQSYSVEPCAEQRCDFTSQEFILTTDEGVAVVTIFFSV